MISLSHALKRFSLAIPLQSYMWARSFCAGLCLTLGFAPFHLPGVALFGIALLFTQLTFKTYSFKQAFFYGFVFGVGFLGFGVSWVFVSIHAYGHLNLILSGFITFLFVIYLALFFAAMTGVYFFIKSNLSLLLAGIIFSVLWCLGEFLRATFLTGFPWLLLGFGQIDTPLRYLLPIVGIYGVGLLACLSATLLAGAVRKTQGRLAYLCGFVGLLLLPTLLKDHQWTHQDSHPISVSVIQTNTSMRDKWDETLFWQLLNHYEHHLLELIGKRQVIVLPESALPVPAHYIGDFLKTLNSRAKTNASAIILGIPQATPDQSSYYNTILGLGHASGSYQKQHLVPFGEYVPAFFQPLVTWLNIPIDNMRPGLLSQSLIKVHKQPVATLLCYELAYPELLRKQIPEARWIISLSDDGWFGRSLAMYQHQQMAQALSLLTGRFQVVANNDGLSSLINAQGEILDSLSALSQGILNAEVYMTTGSTPWSTFGDKPLCLLCCLILLIACYPVWRSRKLVGVKSHAAASPHPCVSPNTAE